MIIPGDGALAVGIVDAIRAGDLDAIARMLAEHPELATAAVGGDQPCGGQPGTIRSLLHVVTDWPGHFPNAVAVVRLLVAAGADVNARVRGPHSETPLHWAASSDDVDVLDALLDAGADIEARGAVIAGGTALSDAAAFGQWNAARRLLERGARTTFWEAATLGLMDRVEAHLAGGTAPDPLEITRAFWGACHGGQLVCARYLLDHGADPHWVGWDNLTPLGAARRSGAGEVVAWLSALEAGG